MMIHYDFNLMISSPLVFSDADSSQLANMAMHQSIKKIAICKDTACSYMCSSSFRVV